MRRRSAPQPHDRPEPDRDGRGSRRSVFRRRTTYGRVEPGEKEREVTLSNPVLSGWNSSNACASSSPNRSTDQSEINWPTRLSSRACFASRSSSRRQHCLYLRPLPHGHSAFRAVFATTRNATSNSGRHLAPVPTGPLVTVPGHRGHVRKRPSTPARQSPARGRAAARRERAAADAARLARRRRRSSIRASRNRRPRAQLPGLGGARRSRWCGACFVAVTMFMRFAGRAPHRQERLCARNRGRLDSAWPEDVSPLTDETIEHHLRGRESIGIYPLLKDDTLLVPRLRPGRHDMATRCAGASRGVR